MISNELQQIVDKFKEQGKMAFLEAATQEKIDIFEKENDITLPAESLIKNGSHLPYHTYHASALREILQLLQHLLQIHFLNKLYA